MPPLGRNGVVASPQERPDARLQLGDGKRLHQIIIGAAVESPHTFVVAIARRQDQHRRGRTFGPKTAEHVEPVELGKT